MRRRRLIIAVIILLALAGVTVVTWKVANWPPPRLILKYGFPPAGGPTGASRRNRGGQVFVEVAPGYRHVRRGDPACRGDLLGRLCRPLGIPIGQAESPDEEYIDRWIELSETLWVTPSGEAALLSYEGSELIEDEVRRGIRAVGSGLEFRRPTLDELLFAAESRALSIPPFAVLRDRWPYEFVFAEKVAASASSDCMARNAAPATTATASTTAIHL